MSTEIEKSQNKNTLALEPTPEFLEKANTTARFLSDVTINADVYLQGINRDGYDIVDPAGEVQWSIGESEGAFEHRALAIGVGGPDHDQIEPKIQLYTPEGKWRKKRDMRYPEIKEILRDPSDPDRTVQLIAEDNESDKIYLFLSRETREELEENQFSQANCTDVIVVSRTNRPDGGDQAMPKAAPFPSEAYRRAEAEELTALQRKMEDLILRNAAVSQFYNIRSEDLIYLPVNTQLEQERQQNKKGPMSRTALRFVGIKKPLENTQERKKDLARKIWREKYENGELPAWLTWDGWQAEHAQDDPHTRQAALDRVVKVGRQNRDSFIDAIH